MPAIRACSECGKPLAGKSVRAKTCCDAHRRARSRRIMRANEQVADFAEANNAGAAEIAAIVRREAPDIVTRVMKDQLAPIVREALTEDVLRAIDDMIGLTPIAVAALTSDLADEDSTVRQRAYTLLLKYTVGHPAIVQAQDPGTGQHLEVNFNLPRPEAPELDGGWQDVVADTVQECDMCHEEKSTEDFVAGSTRCQVCFDEWKSKVLEAFA